MMDSFAILLHELTFKKKQFKWRLGIFFNCGKGGEISTVKNMHTIIKIQ